MTIDSSLNFRIITARGECRELSKKSTVMALGTFDGVHTAHARLLASAVALRDECGAELCGAWCFAESPAGVLGGFHVPMICTLDERVELMLGAGLDFVAIGSFADFCALSAEEFVRDVLIGQLGCVATVCGFNHRFGHRGLGDHTLLERFFGKDKAISLDEIKFFGETVSSSAIRRHLVDGKIDMANAMLGRKFSLTAEVLSGKKLGRRLGFPTVNQQFPKNSVKPARGIYATVCTTEDGKRYIGVSNVGVRPTITDGSDSHVFNCETYIIDFDGNLYGTALTVEFCAYLRGEKKFNSVDELSAAIDNDKKNALAYFGGAFGH
jgi:riboflavin kinase/FMN adenylyltransferase